MRDALLIITLISRFGSAEASNTAMLGFKLRFDNNEPMLMTILFFPIFNSLFTIFTIFTIFVHQKEKHVPVPGIYLDLFCGKDHLWNSNAIYVWHFFFGQIVYVVNIYKPHLLQDKHLHQYHFI